MFITRLFATTPADGLAILLPAAAEAVKTDPHLAVAMLTEAGECAFQAGDEGATLEIAALLAALPDSGDPRDALMAGLYRSVGAVTRGEPPVPSGPEQRSLALRSADLTGADLTGADLTGADLTGS